jgi:hypothetical protein
MTLWTQRSAKPFPTGSSTLDSTKAGFPWAKITTTVAFAVEALRRWWWAMGQEAYPDALQLLVCADAGVSNGYRLRLWKVELSRLAGESSLSATVCHFPPGTSKWNKIEHRLFAHISMNWRGRPLTSDEVVVNLVAATTTRTGLTVRAERDTGTYPQGHQSER